jgi:ferritin-like metal-binding protein YciE
MENSKNCFTRKCVISITAQKVEHYEIAGYGSVRTMDEKLGQGKVAQLLGENENEEKMVDETLTKIFAPLFENARM